MGNLSNFDIKSMPGSYISVCILSECFWHDCISAYGYHDIDDKLGIIFLIEHNISRVIAFFLHRSLQSLFDGKVCFYGWDVLRNSFY